MLRMLIIFVVAVITMSASAVEGHKSSLSQEKKKAVRTVAILIFEGVELLDFTGPAEVFIVADEGKSFKVITVAEKKGPVKTMGGLTVQADFACDNAPDADILVIPGGNMKSVGKQGRQWLKKAADKAEAVLSVCMGAFLAADAGLFDGGEATTHAWGIERLKKAAPKCKVIKGRRFVVSGKVVSTGGVTAGIDGALHVVEKLLGKEAAKWTAEEWMEYRGSESAKQK